MANIIAFKEDNKDLFLFEIDGKIATIAPELMAFEGYKNARRTWFDIKKREEYEEGFEFKTLKDEELKAFKEVLKQNDCCTLVSETPTTLYDHYKRVPSIDLVFEEGIYGVMYTSNSGHANKFKKFMRREVTPKLNKEGSFDLVENKINSIEDEKERALTLRVYNLEKALNADPSDMLTQLNYAMSKQELETFKNSRQIEAINESVKQIENKISKATVLREGDMSAAAVARHFDIYSINNNPHILFAEHIARDLGIYVSPQGNVGYQDEYVSINLVDKGGKTVPEVKYSEKAVELMENYYIENGFRFDKPVLYKREPKEGEFKFVYMLFNNNRRIRVNEETYKNYK